MIPHVTVLTPVYNGEEYLAECIESILAQNYRDFEYIIVNNCSTDRTLEIAESYSRRDGRIHVSSYNTFVSAIENHNRAFSLVPRTSKYCKVVSADDRITPECLGKLVRVAEDNPTVGIVGSYQQSGDTVKWQGLPRSVSVISGTEVCRLGLLKNVHVFGTPTSSLYRADLLRMRDVFFPHLKSYADGSACYEALQNSDFGFVHEVLSTERVHQGQWSTAMDELSAGSVGYLDDVLQYGPRYLDDKEFAIRKKEVFDRYYRFLGGCVLKLRDSKFWDFHRSRLAEMGCELNWIRIATSAMREAITEAKNPVAAFEKVLTVLKGKLSAGRPTMS